MWERTLISVRQYKHAQMFRVKPIFGPRTDRFTADTNDERNELLSGFCLIPDSA